MTYTPNIPLSGQSLGQTRQPINQNFQDIATAFAQNHTPLTTSTLGRHTHVDMPAQAANPNPPPTVVSVYSKQVAGITELFFQREETAGPTPGTVTQLTKGTPVALAQGHTFLPGGLILSYGSRVGPGVVTYSYTTYTAIFSFVLGAQGGGAAFATVVNLANATVSNAGPPATIYYMVIGI